MNARAMVVVAMLAIGCGKKDSADPPANAKTVATSGAPSCAQVMDHLTELAKALTSPQEGSMRDELVAKSGEHYEEALAACSRGLPEEPGKRPALAAMTDAQRSCVIGAKDFAAVASCFPPDRAPFELPEYKGDVAIAAPPPAPPPVASGDPGTAMVLDEGKMGKKDSDRAEGEYKVKGDEDPEAARQKAIEAARQAGEQGVVGALAKDGDDSFQLVMQSPAPAAAGGASTATLVVTPGTGYVINAQYDIKLTLTPPDGLSVAKTVQTVDDAKTSKRSVDEDGTQVDVFDRLAFEIPMTAAAAGTYTLTGQLKFAVCAADASDCEPKRRAVSFTVVAN